MKSYLLRLHLIVVLLGVAGCLSYLLYYLGVINFEVAFVVAALCFMGAVFMFIYIVPYLFYNRLLLEVNDTLNFEYYSFSLPVLKEFKGKGMNLSGVKSFTSINPYMPVIVSRAEDKYIVICVHQLYSSLISKWDWVEKYLRNKIVIEIITPLDLTEQLDISFETLDGSIKPEEFDHTALQKEIRRVFKGTNVKNRVVVSCGQNSFMVQYTGFCSESSQILLWLEMAERIIAEQQLKPLKMSS